MTQWKRVSESLSRPACKPLLRDGIWSHSCTHTLCIVCLTPSCLWDHFPERVRILMESPNCSNLYRQTEERDLRDRAEFYRGYFEGSDVKSTTNLVKPDVFYSQNMERKKGGFPLKMTDLQTSPISGIISEFGVDLNLNWPQLTSSHDATTPAHDPRLFPWERPGRGRRPQRGTGKGLFCLMRLVNDALAHRERKEEAVRAD